jgi:transposase
MKTRKAHPLYRASDALWERVKPLLPEHPNRHKFGGGRPRVPDRKALDGIIFVLRTGCQWKALDETGICSASTAHNRFQEWTVVGVFKQLWRLGLEHYDELKGIDWTWQAMDGVMTKSPLGGEKNGAESDRSSQGRRQTQFAHRGPRRSDRLGGGPGKPTRL